MKSKQHVYVIFLRCHHDDTDTGATLKSIIGSPNRKKPLLSWSITRLTHMVEGDFMIGNKKGFHHSCGDFWAFGSAWSSYRMFMVSRYHWGHWLLVFVRLLSSAAGGMLWRVLWCSVAGTFLHLRMIFGRVLNATMQLFDHIGTEFSKNVKVTSWLQNIRRLPI